MTLIADCDCSNVVSVARMVHSALLLMGASSLRFECACNDALNLVNRCLTHVVFAQDFMSLAQSFTRSRLFCPCDGQGFGTNEERAVSKMDPCGR